jgi:hypothetical protein
MGQNVLYKCARCGRNSRRTKSAYTLFIIDSTQRSQQQRRQNHHSNDFTTDDGHRLPPPTRCQSFHQTMGQLLTLPMVSCVVRICCCCQWFVVVVNFCQSSLNSFHPLLRTVFNLPADAVGICCCHLLLSSIVFLVVVDCCQWYGS